MGLDRNKWTSSKMSTSNYEDVQVFLEGYSVAAFDARFNVKSSIREPAEAAIRTTGVGDCVQDATSEHLA